MTIDSELYIEGKTWNPGKMFTYTNRIAKLENGENNTNLALEFRLHTQPFQQYGSMKTNLKIHSNNELNIQILCKMNTLANSKKVP